MILDALFNYQPRRTKRPVTYQLEINASQAETGHRSRRVLNSLRRSLTAQGQGRHMQKDICRKIARDIRTSLERSRTACGVLFHRHAYRKMEWITITIAAVGGVSVRDCEGSVALLSFIGSRGVPTRTKTGG